jgi:hypothetical protein
MQSCSLDHLVPKFKTYTPPYVFNNVYFIYLTPDVRFSLLFFI